MYYTLTDIVNTYLIEKGEDSKHSFPRYLDIAVNGLKDLHWGVDGTPQVAILTLDHLNSATKPKDCLKIYRMAYIDNSGEIVEIYKNNDLAVNYLQKFNCQANQYVAPTVKNGAFYPARTNPTVNYPNYYRNGENLGGRFGAVGGGSYTYNIDETTGTIQFSTLVKGEVIIEYLSDPKLVNGKFKVHPFLQDSLLAWIEWRSQARKSNIGRGEKMALKQEYYAQRHQARVMFATESLGNYMNAKRKSASQTAKY